MTFARTKDPRGSGREYVYLQSSHKSHGAVRSTHELYVGPLAKLQARGGLAAIAVKRGLTSDQVAEVRRLLRERAAPEPAQPRTPETVAVPAQASPSPVEEVRRLEAEEAAAKEAYHAAIRADMAAKRSPDAPSPELVKARESYTSARAASAAAFAALTPALQVQLRQKAAKAAPAPAPTASAPWAMNEAEYLANAERRERARLDAAHRHATNEVATAKGEKAKTVARVRQEVTRRQLEQFDEPAHANHRAIRLREAYATMVRSAISQGEPVPAAIIAQRPEFQKARNSRERYEKGRHTSFANQSIAVDHVLRAKHGVKVKRQDGSPIEQGQVYEIDEGLQDIDRAIGPVTSALRDRDLTIAHTNGKHPFLKNGAAGLYTIDERTVTVGYVRKKDRALIPTLAHELAGHALDYEAGGALGTSTRVPTKSGKVVSVTSLAENDYRYNRGGAQLIYDARRTMRDTEIVRNALRKGDGSQRFLERRGATEEDVEEIRVALGPYWNEPREVWARLVEQYVSTELGRGGPAAQAAYHEKAGYWDKSEFETLRPRVRAELDRRLEMVRAAKEASGAGSP